LHPYVLGGKNLGLVQKYYQLTMVLGAPPDGKNLQCESAGNTWALSLNTLAKTPQCFK